MKAHLQHADRLQRPSSRVVHARHLFWIAYICDKGFSLVSGLSPVLPDSECDLTLPTSARNTDSSSTDSEDCEKNGTDASYMNVSLRLALIQSHIYQLLYTPAALKMSHADLLRTIRKLDDSLESWRESIQCFYRPSFATFLENSNGTHDLRSSIFHLQYHHCIMMIHQTSSRCYLWKENQDTQDMASSLAITVAASRHLLGSFLTSRFDLNSQNLL